MDSGSLDIESATQIWSFLIGTKPKTLPNRTPSLHCHAIGKPESKCIEAECDQRARGSSGKCFIHSKDRRCDFYSDNGICTRAAVGRTTRCVKHGGGYRCQEEGCTKSAIGTTERCRRHGGGRRCAAAGCTGLVKGLEVWCQAHNFGGEKRICARENCETVIYGSADHCRIHAPVRIRFSRGDISGDIPNLAQ